MNEIDKLKAKQAELARELESVGERIEALETEKYRIGQQFVPGWTITCIEQSSDGDTFKKILTIVQETKGEIATPNTRYNWPEIIKKYPEAQWASTDEDGRVDLWKGVPRINIGLPRWEPAYETNLAFGGYARAPLTPDWRVSLEKRPDWI